MESILQGLGLKRNETKVYLGLLREGPCNLKQVTETCGLFRANALDAIEGLSQKGLVGISFHDKRHVYQAVDPDRLSGLVDEKKAQLDSILPMLSQMGASREKASIDILRGRPGLITILNDEILAGKTIYTMQSSETVDKKAGAFLAVSRARRAAAKMTMKIVYPSNDKSYAKEAARFPNTEVRIQIKNQKNPVTIDVYSDRAVLIFGSEPTIIRIQDPMIAERFKSLFNLAWAQSKPFARTYSVADARATASGRA